jgi:adenylylsulfate kinase
MIKSTNIYRIETKVSTFDREQLLNQRSILLWFTGLSGSGKSTLATQVEYQLFQSKFKTYLLDGDNVRFGLNKNLGFSEEDRQENIRRIGEVSKLMVDAGLIVLSSFISPFRSDRDQIRQILGDEKFVEIFVDCPLEVCEQRDVKGLYQKARNGEIKNFTGIDSPYEKPENPHITVHTDKEDLTESVDKVIKYIISKINL